MTRDHGPDHQLASEQFPALNQRFYRADPADYFRRRLHSLLLMAGRPTEIQRLLTEGVEYKSIKVAVGGASPDHLDNQESLDAYVTTESEVLLHHTAEALMRLFLAHRSLPACPQLEIARLRSPRALKQRLSHFLSAELAGGLQDDVSLLFLGDRDTATGDMADNWDEYMTGVHGLLRFFSQRLLDGANLYNVMKHGFAVSAANVGFSLSDRSEGILMSVDGPSIRYLEARQNSAGQPRWCETTAWINPDRAMAATGVATFLIETLWKIAKARYVGGQPGVIHVFTRAHLDALMPAGEMVVSSMREELLYYAPDTSSADEP